MDTIKIAEENAERAGVEDDILFECKNFLNLEPTAEKGCLVTNPPYGERLLNDEKVERLYTLLGDICRTRFPKWSYYIITSCLLYTSPSPRDGLLSRMPSSA